MSHGFAATVVLLAASGSAGTAHAVEPLEHAYELELERLTLPSGPSGAVGIEPCPGCVHRAHALTQRTRYFVNGRPRTFDELQEIAATLRAGRRSGRSALAAVFIDVATARVSRVALHFEDRR